MSEPNVCSKTSSKSGDYSHAGLVSTTMSVSIQLFLQRVFTGIDMWMAIGQSCKSEAFHAGAHWQAGVRKAQVGT
jgi:hypothetical protein